MVGSGESSENAEDLGWIKAKMDPWHPVILVFWLWLVFGTAWHPFSKLSGCIIVYSLIQRPPTNGQCNQW